MARPKGKLPEKLERQAKFLMNPANFAETFLGFKLAYRQRQALEACMAEGSCVAISAPNGGGKTNRILPALVLWHQTIFPFGKTKVTSGAYMQIEDQIWPAISMHKDKFKAWKWLETPYCTTTIPGAAGREGFINCFTTNHPGRAEGDHADLMDQGITLTPQDRNIVPLLFVVDEAKTSALWLRGVIEGRVRPTRLVLMSSMGFSEGWFYEACTTLSEKMGGKFKYVKITADDCPWMSKEEVEGIRKDWIGFPEFAESILGFSFLPLVQDSVINGRALDENLANPPKPKKGDRHLFCDFAWSGSGDENVLAMRDGNVITIEDTFHCDNLHGICDRFVQNFRRLNLSPSDVGIISGDEGGGGKLIMDELDRRGWYLNRVQNGAAAVDSEHYANTAAEIWYEGGKHITMKTFVLPNDRVLRGQLLNRKQVVDPKMKLKVESKDDMKQRGVQSPDRADAILGCMAPTGGFAATYTSWAMACQMGSAQPAGTF